MQSTKEIDFTQRSLARASTVWGLAALFYLYEIMLLVSPSVMVDSLASSFKTSAEQLGNLAAFYYYAYALMQIPVGLLMDRFGPRILLTIASGLCCIGCIIFATAPVLWCAQAGRFIMGIGGAFAVVGCLKLASFWFPLNRFALLTGVMVAVGMMGGVFGQKPVALLVMHFGWRTTMLIGGFIGAILSLIIWSVITDHPFNKASAYKLGSGTYSIHHQLSLIFSGLLEVMKNPQIWIVSLYAGLMFVPTTAFGQLWGVPYFIERFELPKDAAGWMVSMIFFGWAIGGPFYGWFSDKIQRRRLPMTVAAIGTLLIMVMILYAPVTPFSMKILMFCLGAFSSGFILAFSLVREINQPLLTGTAIGFINTLNNASGALAQPIVGKLLDKFWDGKMLATGAPLYSVPTYNEALLFLPICILIAILTLPFVRETFCQPVATVKNN